MQYLYVKSEGPVKVLLHVPFLPGSRTSRVPLEVPGALSPLSVATREADRPGVACSQGPLPLELSP